MTLQLQLLRRWRPGILPGRLGPPPTAWFARQRFSAGRPSARPRFDIYVPPPPRKQPPPRQYERFGRERKGGSGSGGGGGRRSELYKSKTFRYLLFGGVPLGGLYYITHLEPTPVTGRTRFMTISAVQEEQMSKESYNEIMRTYGARLLPDSHPSTRTVRSVMKRIIRASGATNVKWEIHVIDSPEMNAFVLPGGKVFVFSGILPVCANEDGLAAVLGHETSHQLCRHMAEKMSFAVVVFALRTLVSLFIDPSFATNALFELGLDLPFSRKCESEADYVGLLLMSQACFNPEEAAHVWERMSERAKGGNISFLSTHPAPKARAEKIRGWMNEAIAKREESNCTTDLGQYSQQFRLAQRQVIW